MKNKKNLLALALGLFFVAPNVFAFTCDADMKSILGIVWTVIAFIKVAVPVVIVVLAVVDVFKVVTNGKADESERKKAFTTLITRFVLGIVIFFIPTFVNVIFNNLLPGQGATDAINCMMHGERYNSTTGAQCPDGQSWNATNNTCQ